MGVMNNVYDLYNDGKPYGLMANNQTIVNITTNTTTTGATIDCLGYSKCALVTFMGDLTDGDYDYDVYHGDESDMSDEAAIASSDYTGTIEDWDADTDDDAISIIDITLRKRYLRVKIVSTNTSTGAWAGGIAILHGAKHLDVNSTQI